MIKTIIIMWRDVMPINAKRVVVLMGLLSFVASMFIPLYVNHNGEMIYLGMIYGLIVLLGVLIFGGAWILWSITTIIIK